MSSSSSIDRWTTERISRLSIEEIRNLRDNAMAKAAQVVVERCESELARRPPRSARKGRTPSKAFEIKPGAVSSIAQAILALPFAAEVPFALLRIQRQASPASTFADLWREFIVCGLSSQEKSDPGSALDQFAKSDSPLLDLDAVLKQDAIARWASDEFARCGIRRMLDKRSRMVTSVREVFFQALGTVDSLPHPRQTGTTLDLFVNLAIKRLSDSDLTTSAAFSSSIDPTPFFNIGHKQIRNILVNSGLARNVIPLDSRWRDFFGDIIQFKSSDLAVKARYLAIEDTIRKALIQTIGYRPDIANLAVLDSIVFATMSPQGHSIDGWAGRRSEATPP